MIFTEEEAKTKRCPESLPAYTNVPLTGAAISVPVSQNGQWASGMAVSTAPTNCIGSACMAWRWHEVPLEIDNGTFIDDLFMSTRLLNCLKNEGVETVGQARSLPDEQLADIPNMGKTTLAEFKRIFGNSQHIAGTGYCGKAGKP